MPFSADQILGYLQAYYWPFLRISALLVAAPVFGNSSISVRVRILLAVLVTALVAPQLPAPALAAPFSGVGVLVAAQQLVIGLAMGFTLQLVFSAVVVAGESLSMTMGLGFAMTVDPQNGVQVPVIGQFYSIVATLLFLAIDGHLLLLRFLVDSFALLPVGGSVWQQDFAINIVRWASQIFISALLLALPTMTAVLMINIAFGVITRAAPQLNIFAVGFPVTILAGFAFILLSLGSFIDVMSRFFDAGLLQALQLFR